MDRWPDVSVVMPVREDAADLPAAVRTVLGQDYPGRFEVVIAVAPSGDDTAGVAADLATVDPRIRVVANPTGTTPSGLNRAIEAASGTVIARVDARSELPAGYLTDAVALLRETGAANVGGVQRAVGTTSMQRAIAAAMSSRFGTGDARFHYAGPAGPADTVYLGVFRADVLHQLGGFDEELVRNQDYELNVRIRRAGELVWFDPRLQVTYRPRKDLRGLASQYWQYGRWKRATLQRHPGSIRWRQLVPPIAVLANATALLAALRRPWTLVVPAAYVLSVVVASLAVARRSPRTLVRLPAVFATMHHAWGAGFLAGVPSRRARRP